MDMQRKVFLERRIAALQEAPASLPLYAWFNPYGEADCPDPHDAEMNVDPVGNVPGWTWERAPGADLPNAGADYDQCPGWLHVWVRKGDEAILRCTDPGNFPTHKAVLLDAHPTGPQWRFEFRSCIDRKNYISWVLQADSGENLQLSAWACYRWAWARQRVGPAIKLPASGPFLLELGNHPYYSWADNTVDWRYIPSPTTRAITRERQFKEQHRKAVNYVELRFGAPSADNDIHDYFLDYVRFEKWSPTI